MINPCRIVALHSDRGIIQHCQQVLLLRYSSFRENHFYVKVAESQAVWKQALLEMKHGLQIAGFSRGITMIDFGITADVSQFVTEIQIPVNGKP